MFFLVIVCYNREMGIVSKDILAQSVVEVGADHTGGLGTHMY